MRSVPLVLACLLAACSLGPPPRIEARGAPIDCNDLRRGLLGTWMSGSSAMELRPDGSLLRDSVEGALRWTAPGHVVIDIAGTHEEHTYGLTTSASLLDVDTNGRARTWTRVSLVPAYAEGCFDMHGSLVGNWTDGTTIESFGRDGTYTRGDTRGNWSIVEAGYVDLGIGRQVRRYRLGLATRDMMVTASEGPILGDDPRGSSLIEVRVP